ncbi:MAG: phosphatidylinositol-specific phospholipase C/glycerophosphodiester phosphodiesterase family protein [Verrucomicrobiota bacterium]
MEIKIRPVFFAMALSLGVVCPGHAEDAPPLVRAHAHNDYEHARPLLDAMERKFCSIEADIHLASGKLLVAHDAKSVRPDRTLEKLYLQPLREQILRNGGRVYRGGPSVILLVDVKTEREATYAALRAVLKSYSDILTKFEGDRIETNAITVIISGNVAKVSMSREKSRLAACDGHLAGLGMETQPALFPLLSEEWKTYFEWNGEGEISPEERRQLRAFVAAAHRNGRRLRFWGTADSPAVWRELWQADVDLIGADDLDALEKFLRALQ